LEGQKVRLRGERRHISRLTRVFKRYNPNYPFEYFFVDYCDLWKLTGERHFGILAALFAGMAIFISCLGLFGLSAYMAESRLREVGVRKVLGASIMRLVTLLSKDFLVLVVIAFFIASPVAWWFMSKWLENIPYHINLSWWIFGVTGLLSILIAAGTVGFQAVQAALTNPVRVLRADQARVTRAGQAGTLYTDLTKAGQRLFQSRTQRLVVEGLIF